MYWLIIPAVLLIYLIVVVFFPGFDFQESSFRISGVAPSPEDTLGFRRDFEITVQGNKVRGWFYEASGPPDHSSRSGESGDPHARPGGSSLAAPCIILATGLGGDRTMGLEAFALKYREAGYHCISFDYRNFGSSEGEPRNLFSQRMQLEDLRAVMQYARTLKEVSSLIIWGTSAAGSYGLVVAAEESGTAGEVGTEDPAPIVSVICQVPGLSAKEEFKHRIRRLGWGRFLRLFMHAQRDRGRGRLGLSAHYIPMVGDGSFALLEGPGAVDGYRTLCSGEFDNRICARSLIMPPGPDPEKVALRVRCPVLIQIAQQDTLISPSGHLAVVAALGHRGTLRSYPGNHFDIYRPPLLDQLVEDQLEFLQKATAS